MKTKMMITISLIGIITLTTIAQTNVDYFGQTPPSDSAIIFAPGIISLPDRMEGGIAFAPDGKECYINVCVYTNNKFINKIYYTKRINNKWTEQIEAPFSVNQNISLSSFSTNGNRLYFDKDKDIWMIKRINGGWSEAQRLPSPINSDFNDGGYIETADSVAYLYSNRPGEFGENFDIWRIRHSVRSLQAENLGSIVNSNTMQVTPCIAPDGSYLIFAQPVNNSLKLFVSFKKGNGEWTIPENMDKTGAFINILNQADPSLSPDGKYLFFNRHAGNPTNIMDIYWVSTKVIDDIKKVVFNSKDTK